MTKIAKFTLLVLALLAAPLQATPLVNPAEIQAIYREWLQALAERRPADAIAMTSDDFVMVNGQTLLDRVEALSFQEALAQFILSRQCTDNMVAFKQLPQKNALLLSRVDCLYQTVQGPLAASLFETIIVNSKGEIIYNHFSAAESALP
jgi:hypothetical protein